jgi:hypothetical protein
VELGERGITPHVAQNAYETATIRRARPTAATRGMRAARSARHERPAEGNPPPTTSRQCCSARASQPAITPNEAIMANPHDLLPQPVKEARFQRLWGALSFGIIEQILLSGSSFVMTAAMAHTLGPTEFGWFGIGWSIALLFEAAVMGLMGDSAPAIAHRLPANLRSRFRAVYLIIYVGVSGILVFISLFITLILLSWNERGVLLASLGVFFAQRLQNTIRRIYYIRSRSSLLAPFCQCYGDIAYLRRR